MGILLAKKSTITFGIDLACSIRVTPQWFGQLSECLMQVKAYVRLCWLKSIAGGWTTTRRMDEAIKWPCIYGCQDCHDELMHYLICPILWQFPLPHVGMIDSIFIGDRLGMSFPSVQKLKALAIVHAVYHFCKNDPACSSTINSFVQGTTSGSVAFALVQYRASGFARTAASMT